MDSTNNPNAPWTRLLRMVVVPPLIVAGMALCAVAAVAASVIALWPQNSPEFVPPVTLPLVAESVREPARCDGCGTIETITRMEDQAQLAVYAFTVRMRDGSARRSSEWPRGRWREGDHVILIGGAGAREAEERDAER
jgi:hypothetical protein